jgi:glycosyltransferase involved in cell wall biosynthesis
MVERLVIAAPNGWDSPSARIRLGPLAEAGLCEIETVATGSFPRAVQVERLLELAEDHAALVLQRVMPGRSELHRLRRAYRHLIFDMDDAIYAVPPDLAANRLAKGAKGAIRLMLRGATTASSRRRPLRRTLSEVDACVAGNSILAEFAQGHAKRVVEIPTTVDPIRDPPRARPAPPVVVWEGMLSNMQHLVLAKEALRAVARDVEFRLRIVASATWRDSPVPVEFVPWSPQTSRDALSTSTIGLAPLIDGAWTRGKCAFRSVQYGGYALPAIASPVGITDRVVLQGKTGYLASSTDQWEQALRTLLSTPDQVAEMGAAALQHVRTHYSNALAVDRWSDLLRSLGGASSSGGKD